jgi:hypothetical protein
VLHRGSTIYILDKKVRQKCAMLGNPTLMQKKGLMQVHALLHYRVSEPEGKILKNVNFNTV